MRVLIWRWLLCVLLLQGASAYAASSCVVLVHGLAGQPWNWWRLAPLLEAHSYQVVKARYASRKLTVAQASQAVTQAVSRCEPARDVAMVGHSLGGILIRHYLAHTPNHQVTRVVMLGTPNQGSHLAVRANRKYWHEQGIARLMGPVVAELQAVPSSTVNQLPAMSVPTGVLAGYLTPTPWLTKRFGRVPNDGLVAVDNTKVAGMSDFALIKATHMGLLFDVDAQRQVLWFLQAGHFFHAQPVESRAD